MTRTLYAVIETKPPGTPGKVRRLIIAEWAHRENAENDCALWQQHNPMLQYTVEAVKER